MEPTDYLKLDSARVSYGGYWRWKPGLPFLYLAFRKLVRWRFQPTVLVPAQPTLQRVDPADAPADLRATLAEPIAACQRQQFQLSFWYQVPTLGTHTGLAAAMLGPGSLTVALATAAQGQGGLSRDLTLSLVSRLRSRRLLATGAAKTFFTPPPEVDALLLRGRSFDELIAAHERRVNLMQESIVPVTDAERLILDLQNLHLRASIARGVYIPAQPDDVRRFS
jgi:hypothetical protein